MAGWFKQMIERCTRRKAEGRCASCAMQSLCPHAASLTGEPSRRESPSLGDLFHAFGSWIDQRSTVSRSPSVSDRVVAILKRRLPDGNPAVDSIASELGMTRSTLYRRLNAEGSNVERLLAQVRTDLAEHFLRREGLSVKATAYRLGFSDPAAFSRAYKRWTGSSPSVVAA